MPMPACKLVPACVHRLTMQELNAREREIFTQLISSGVDENDPSLNDVHK